MMIGSTKAKSAAQDGYFGDNYDRIMAVCLRDIFVIEGRLNYSSYGSREVLEFQPLLVCTQCDTLNCTM